MSDQAAASELHDLVVREAIEHRHDRIAYFRRHVSGSGGCLLCGAQMINDHDRHAMWHLHLVERIERLERLVAARSEGDEG